MNTLGFMAVVFVAKSYFQTVLNDFSDVDDDAVDTLVEKYGLKTNRWANFKSGEIWRSLKTVGDDPEAVAILLAYEEGVCGPFNTFQKDRLYVWNKGSNAQIDIFEDDGKLVQKCLGDPLEDINCNYEVHIPAGTIANLRPQDGGIVYTGIIFLGTTAKHGKGLDYDTVLNKYPQHEEVIKKTKKCYA